MADKKLKRSFDFFKAPVRLFAKLKYNFEAAPFEGDDGPYLILFTHTCAVDMLLGSHSFKEPIRYVASEHVLRKGFAAFLLRNCFHPILKKKGVSDISTVRNILRSLKAGEWVGLFPEGNCTHDGETLYIGDSIGKLAKAARVNVLLYTVEKGFLATPRWADHARRGPKLVGSVKAVITKRQCEQLSAEQLTELIVGGLYRNATPLSPKNTVEFFGKNLAEHLERGFFICPRCKAVASIRTHGDGISCDSCDFTAKYLPTGYLAGDNLPFETLPEWDAFQRGQIVKSSYKDGELICADKGETAWLVNAGERAKKLWKGELRLYADRLEFWHGESVLTLGFDTVGGVSVVDKQTVQISAGENFYEFKNDRPRSGIKYLYFINYLLQIRQGGFDGHFGI